MRVLVLLALIAAGLFAASFIVPANEYIRAGLALDAAEEVRREAERQADLVFHEHELHAAPESRDRCERALQSVRGAVDVHHAARERQIAARDGLRVSLRRWQSMFE